MDVTARDKCNKKCLLRLKDAGLIERIPIFYTHPTTGSTVRDGVNLLTRAGAELVETWLIEEGRGRDYRWHPGLKEWSEVEIRHELAVNDFAIALHCAAGDRGWDVIEWHDDDQLQKLKERTALGDLIPDGICVLESPSQRLPLFFELDRGTEPVTGRSANRWERKIDKYDDYFRTRFRTDPFFTDLLGYDTDDLADPVVLAVTTKGELRMRNLVEATRAGGVRDTYWHTTTKLLYPAPPDETQQRLLRGDKQTAPQAQAIQRAFQVRRREAFWQPIWTLAGSTPGEVETRSLASRLTFAPHRSGTP